MMKYFLIFIFVVCGTQIFAQKHVSGVVTDKETKETLIGVTVQVKGRPASGTVTDIDGKYKIQAVANDVLVFSYIGMEKKEVTVGSTPTINVALTSSTHQLDEVVAIGYGVVKKSDLTGSVAVVSAKDLTKTPSASAAQALQGKAPGVLVTQTGQPGSGISIRVRGVGSIHNSSDPIYILDGVRVSDINGLQPQDIENFQVLKDASATAIYGANGSNGVIIVNTKRGKSGKPVVSLNSYLTLNAAPKHIDVMNASEYANYLYKNKYQSFGLGQTYVNSQGSTLTNPAYTLSPEFRQKYYGSDWAEGTDWQSELFRTAVSQNHNISISGGGDNSNFNVSFSYNNEQGNVIKSAAENYTIRANSDFKLNKYFKIGENLSSRYSIIQEPTSVQSSVWDLTVSPLMKIYNPNYRGGFESFQTSYWLDGNGNLNQSTADSNGPLSYTNTLGNDKANPLCSVALGDNTTKTSQTNASVYAQIDFTDYLMFKSTPSVGLKYSKNRYWMPKFVGNRANSEAILSETHSSLLSLNLENQLLFTKNFNKTHNIQATLVQQVHQELADNISGSKSGFSHELLNTFSNGGSENSDASLRGGRTDYRELSYLARLIYDYKSKYFLTASTRRDEVSSFAPGHRIGYFSAGSLAWKVNSDFLKDVKSLDALKLRVGWGQTGNSQTLGSYYEYYDQISSSNNFSPVFGDDQHIADAQYIFYGMGSTYYHWETAQMTNVGVDLNMFNGKLQTSLEYYIKDVNDLLIRKPISNAFGRVDGNPWVNLGSLRNKGIEFSVQWRDRIGKLEYGITSNLTTIQNEVKSMVNNSPETETYNRTAVGHSVGALYGYVSEGIIQAKDDYTHYPMQNGKVAQPGDIKFKDMNGDGEINDKDRTIIGKTIPGLNASLGFDANYKGFDFNIFFYGVADYQIFNQQRASLSSVNSQDMDHNKLASWASNYWTPANASTKYVRYDAANANMNDRISTFWIEDGSFLRIKDVQIGYSLPANLNKKIGVNSFRVYATASNLYCITGYEGRDPEGLMSTTPLTSGVDTGGYTVPRSMTLGIQIGF